MPASAKKPAVSRKEQAVNLEALGLEMGTKPPQALDVEEAVLGAILVEPSVLDEAMEELRPSCFYEPTHRMIFDAMRALVNEHAAVDIITVANKLGAMGNLEAVGGAVTLVSLSQQIGAAANIEYYIRILKQKNIQRELIAASHRILKDSYDESVNVDDLIDTAQSQIYDAIQDNGRKDVIEIGSLINTALNEIQEMQGKTGLNGVPSGFPTLDHMTMGWQASDLIILAARPSVGKTAFSLNLARNAAVEHNIPVAFFSLEMSAIQLVKRLMTSESGLPAEKIKGGSKLETYEWQQLEMTLQNLTKAPLYIDDTPGIPLTEFRSKAKRLVKQKKVRLIIVDYLQLMQGPPDLRGMREQEVAAISRSLKATAKELNVPIIALSQLSRQAVQREKGNGKPMLSDLRESGSIEQDADMVIFIHRPDFLGLSETPEGRETTYVIIAKHRNGETGEIPMRFKSERVKFIENEETLTSEYGGGTVASAMNSDLGAPVSFPEDNPYNNPDF